MNPLNLIPSPYRLLAIGIAIAVTAIALLWTGHHYGAQGVQAEWDREKAERKQTENETILRRIKENERKAEQDKINSSKIAKVNKDEMDKLRNALAAARLRQPAWCSGVASAADSDSPNGGNGADPGSRLLPPEVERTVRQLIEETERVAATGRACQEFVRSNGMAPE